ncbi:tyrosine-type recombinase/integrase [Bremerella sp.]|uniref:tyrosine-type recombinase/integrase n=1 Tax=Bremerella sp. TaxID=2795602 RepID=UPI00391B866E
MARKRKQRRQQHGSAWHWKQTDCWYYTEPGTKKRISLLDEQGERIRGKENKEAAQLALARVKLVEELSPIRSSQSGEWTVARVFEVYLEDLHRTANPEWASQVNKWHDDLSSYCGGLSVREFKKKHLRAWLQKHTTWNHNTQRNVIASVNAAFNFCCKMDDLNVNPIAGYEKPAATPRVTAFTPEEEQQLYQHANEAFGQFIRACILTGARPFSELAKITADHVVETRQGMIYLLKARTSDGQHGHKSAKKTGKDRRIMLCDAMEEMTKELVKSAPKGSGIPLFRTLHGKPWTRGNGVQRFCELRKKIGLPAGKSLYTARHTYAKRVLSGYATGKPVSIEVLAGLLGNTPAVAWRHYAAWTNEYNDPLWAALGKQKAKAA